MCVLTPYELTGQRTSYGYDAAARRTLLNDSFGRTTTSYDAKGRTALVAQPGGKRVGYAYDAADRRRYLTDPDGGRTSYTHDAAGRLILLNAPNVGRTTLAYDAADRNVLRLPGGSGRMTQVYDAAGQLTVLATTRPDGSAVNRFTYSYDPASRRTGVLQSDGSRGTYAYDPAGQLVRERRGGANPADATFTYNPAGNRTLLIDSGVRTTSTFDAANQLLLDLAPPGRTTYAYDPAGNRSRLDDPSTSTFYSWDAKNRLTQAEPAAGPVTLAYDGDGRRTRKQTPTQTKRFLYDFEKVLQDTDDSGLTQKQYLNTEEQYGDLISAYGSGQARYFAPDGLGSTDALLAPDGSSPDRYAYRTFGLDTHTQGTDDNRYTWVGQQGYVEDLEIALYFIRARYYDPKAARMASRDPDGFGAGDHNLYRYAFNDPVNHTDPSGKRLLIRTCQIDPNDRTSSFPADILRDEINNSRNLPNILDGQRIRVGQWVQAQGATYGQLNLVDPVRPTFWGKVNRDAARGDLLSRFLALSLEKDLLIVGWSEGWYNQPPHHLDWRDPDATPLALQLTAQINAFGGAVLEAGGQAGAFLNATLDEGVNRAVLVGLSVLLEQAKAVVPELDRNTSSSWSTSSNTSARWRRPSPKTPSASPLTWARDSSWASRSSSSRSPS